jgi:hypothetical protein
MRRLEFLICGSPTDAFWSQVAMFRLSLDAMGGEFRAARLVLVLGDDDVTPLPDRWRAYFRHIELAWTPHESFQEFGDGHDHLFSLIDPSADLTFICDADTLPIRPFSDGFLQALLVEPAIGGVIAHYFPEQKDGNFAGLDSEAFWQLLAQRVLGRPIKISSKYTLNPEQGGCPFYINYGFVAAKPALLRELHEQLAVVRPRIVEQLDSVFGGQMAIALAIERGGIPCRALPMRYNFPNDPIADRLYPEELRQIKLLHYLRTREFDRHQIFADRDGFERFLNLELEGSNEVLKRHVEAITGGSYPFD